MQVARTLPQLLIPMVIFTAVWVAWDLLRARPFDGDSAAVGALSGLVFGVVQIADKRRTARRAKEPEEEAR